MGKLYYNKSKYFIFRRELTVFCDFQFFWDVRVRIGCSFERKSGHAVEVLTCGMCVRQYTES